VTDPQLRAGEKKFDSGELGVLTWYFMLAERMPLRDALAAADGWGGDQYVAFDRNGESCARMTYTGRTSRDTTRMLVALRRWIAAAPGSPAQVRRVGHELSFQSCDTGKSSRVGRDASERALELVGIRANVGVGFLRQGAPEWSARCAATKLVRAFSFAQLTEPKLYEKHPAALQRARRIVASCR
jgi:hypothetical protein